MKFLILGDPVLDRFVYGIVHRQSPEDQSIPVIDFVAEDYQLGGALKTAECIRFFSDKLKDEVYVSSIISNFTANMLKQKNIFYDSIIFEEQNKPHVRELIKERIMHSETHKQFLRLDNRLCFDSGDIQRYKNKCYYYNAKEFDAVIISDYEKGLVDNFLIEKLKEVQCPFFVDTKKENLSLWSDLKNCFVKINRKEFEKAKNSDLIENLIVTRGRESTLLISYGEILKEFTIDNENCIDPYVIGAGDIWLSAFVVFYMKNKNLHESIMYANKTATECVKKGKLVKIEN
ncbi:hypothetical protein HYV49_03460 [Candidatus Pacearchaeota archaeon]|nr:hypothetical protein [Candidatus Pacearchaeota archaeon]